MTHTLSKDILSLISCRRSPRQDLEASSAIIIATKSLRTHRLCRLGASCQHAAGISRPCSSVCLQPGAACQRKQSQRDAKNLTATFSVDESVQTASENIQVSGLYSLYHILQPVLHHGEPHHFMPAADLRVAEPARWSEQQLRRMRRRRTSRRMR